MTTKRRDREVDNEPGPPSTSTVVDGNAEVVMTTNQWPIVLLRTMPPFTLLRAPLDRVGGGGAPPPHPPPPPPPLLPSLPHKTPLQTKSPHKTTTNAETHMCTLTYQHTQTQLPAY